MLGFVWMHPALTLRAGFLVSSRTVSHGFSVKWPGFPGLALSVGLGEVRTERKEMLCQTGLCGQLVP